MSQKTRDAIAKREAAREKPKIQKPKTEPA